MKPLSVDNKARYSYRRRSEREIPIENKKNVTNVIAKIMYSVLVNAKKFFTVLKNAKRQIINLI